jgi:hypothetical protein
MEQLLSSYLPLGSALVTIVFAYMVLKRWGDRRPPYLLLWGVGFLMYAIGGLMEALFGFFGWSPLVFRLWYLFGAILVAAWLGQGTAYLLIRRTIGGLEVSHVLMAVLAVGSLYAAFKVSTAALDPALMLEGELSGGAITSSGVRGLTPFFNIYGVLLLVGGALYSAYIYWRKRLFANRMIGNILIAAGAMAPAFGGALQRSGVPVALYVGEFVGAVLMFGGFLYTVRPERAGSASIEEPVAGT